MSLALNTLRIVCVYNPFESLDYREEKIVKLEDNSPVSEYIKKYFEEIPQTEEICACYNGSYVKHDFIVQHGGLLTFTVIPSGGDNMSLRMLAAVAIVVVSSLVAPGAGTAIASSITGSTLAAAEGTMLAHAAALTVAAAINIGGMMLLNAIWPVPVPKDVKEGSRTYSFSGASNATRDGDVLPDLIGTCRFSPPLIGAYRSLEGDISSIQYINLLYAIGDISDGIHIIMKDLESTVEGDPLKTGYKVFLNNSEQSMTELDRMQTSLVYVNDQNYADQLASTAGISINTYFNNTVHEVDVGKQIPLDIHYETSEAVSVKAPGTPVNTYNGYQYKSIAIATVDPGTDLYETIAPAEVNTTEKDNVTTAKIAFSFAGKEVIDRIAGDIDIEIPGTLEGETVVTKQDILKICWDCVCKYRLGTSGTWQFKKFSIFSPEWNGTNEINGGLWFENSELDHPDDDVGEVVVEGEETRGSQFSFSVLFPSAGKWQYGFECYSTRVFFSESRKVIADYTTGLPTINVPDFVEVVQYEECTPDAVSEFEVDALYDINELTIVFSFPNGVVQYSTKDNSAKYLELNILIGLKRTDSTATIEKTLTVRRRTRTPFRYAMHFSPEDLKNLDGVSTKYVVSAVYVGNEKDFAASNKISTCVMDYVQMIKSEPMVYPGVATMALRIKATQKISGSPPTVEVIARKSDYAFLYEGTKYHVKSSNPAWACLHRLINLFGVKFDHVNVDQFLEWATFCDENKYECNYYIDTEMSLSETLTLIARCGRATVVQRGIKYGVIIDRVTAPVQLFTDGNIVAGSFNETYISDEELANVVCVWYSDTKTTSGMATKKAIEVRANNIPVDEEIKRISVEFEGCTNKDDAKKYAIQLLNQTIATTRIVEFIAAIDAIVCEVGDVVMISTNAMDWTLASGRTEVVTSTYFEIDKPIKHHASYNQYKIRIRKNDPASDTDSLIEMTVTPDIPSDQALPFVRFNTNLGLNNENLEDIEHNSFIYSLGSVINDVAVDAKKFRIISIEKESNQLFRIKASEYFDEMYEDDYVINEIETPVVTRDYVSNLVAKINYEYDGTPYITLTWNGKSVAFYVFYKTGSTWVKFGEVNDTICNVRGISFAPNEVCEFSVSVTDNPNTGVRVSILIPDPHTPLKPDEKPNTSDADYLAITGLEIFGQGNNHIWKERDLKIRWNEIVYDFEGQIDAPAEGASTSNMDMRELRKFRVELYDKNMTPIKDYIVYEPHFELPFDENKDLYKRSVVSNVITTP